CFDEFADRRGRAERRSQLLRGHRLMVSGVDVQRPTARRGCKLGARIDGDILMQSHRVEIVGLVTSDIENQPAPKGDVDELKPAADPENRDVAPQGGSDRVELQLIARQIGLLCEVVWIGFPVTGRCDVRPAGEAQSVDVRGENVTRLEHDHLGPCALEGRDVVHARRKGAGRRGFSDREGNAWALRHQGHGMESRRLARSISSMSTPPDARGWMKATMPSAPRRGARSMSSTPSRASFSSVPARSSTM